MIKFTTIIIISLIIFVIGWVFIGVGLFRKSKTKSDDRLNTILGIIGIVIVATSLGLVLGEKERQVEMRPKVFQAKEYTLETVIKDNDTTYIITKIVR